MVKHWCDYEYDKSRVRAMEINYLRYACNKRKHLLGKKQGSTKFEWCGKKSTWCVDGMVMF